MATEAPATPQVHRTVAAARGWTDQQRARGQRVALVPTMGALHEGHLQLVRRARQLADVVAVSIFVNPTQFGPHEDFQRYPRTLEQDLALLSREGVAMVFNPTAQEMYGERFSTFVSPPAVARPLEGQFRGDHFRGVCTIVLKLFNIIPAHVAVFGQKDYQQARVVAAMVDDLNLPITLDILPTVREPDGLAMSSRNRYLAAEDRQRALALWQALQHASALLAQGQRDAAQLQAAMLEQLQRGGVEQIDYAAVVDPVTLAPLQHPIAPSRDQPQSAERSPAAVALIAAHVSGTRLIDNQLLYTS